jgi:hypothetical protein
MNNTHLMSFFALSALFMVGAPAQASTEFSTGRDLECTVEILAARSADLGTPGGHFTFDAKARNPVVRFQGPLATGVRQNSPVLTQADFTVATDETHLAPQIAAHFPAPSIQVLFQNGVLSTRISGGGKVKTFSTQTGWQVPGTVGTAEQDNLVIKDLPAEGLETWVSLTCSPTFSHVRPQ